MPRYDREFHGLDGCINQGTISGWVGMSFFSVRAETGNRCAGTSRYSAELTPNVKSALTRRFIALYAKYCKTAFSGLICLPRNYLQIKKMRKTLTNQAN